MHFDFGGRDIEKMAAFYASVFDWDTSEPYGPSARVARTGAGKGIEGHLTSLGHEPHQYVMVYIEVPDIEESLKRVADAGGSTMIPATDVPGGGRFAWFHDPEGNTLGLWSAS